MTIHENLGDIPLIVRSLPPAFIKEGSPTASGRVLAVSEDRRTDRVVWECTPGSLALEPDPSVIDVGYVLFGRATVCPDGGDEKEIRPGTLIEFPRQPYVFRVLETLRKVSFIYRPAGLALIVEPL